MKKIFFLIFIFGVTSQSISASEQYPDIMIYNGIEYGIDVYPLETYYEMYPYKRPLKKVTSSALWRGYRARYEIINNELILTGIQMLGLNGEFSRIDKRRMKVKTFTGKVSLFNGESTGVWMGFTPIYENYIVFEINEGKIINIYNNNCYEYLESIIQLYPAGSYEFECFTKKLTELHERKD
jgi:hypothetical protein